MSLPFQQNGKQKSPVTAGCCSSSYWAKFGHRLLFTLVGILLVYAIVYLGTLMRNNVKAYGYIGRAELQERWISVSGTGKVNANNDIAMTTIGFSNTNKDVAQAQKENRLVMDKVLSALKALGIADKDLQSDYSIYPEYNYTDQKGRELTGYRVSNVVSVKIRDLDKIGEVLSLAGQYGANEVGGLNFTIDDPENLKAEARDKALSDAREKAEKLARSLGVRLVEIVSYSESGQGGYFPLARSLAFSDGMGMGEPEAVATGSQEVTVEVSVTYRFVSK